MDQKLVSVYCGTNDLNYYENLRKKFPFVKLLNGTGYPSFSKLVNDCIRDCPTEIFIFISFRVDPELEHFEKIVNLLNQGYAYVGLYRFAMFGFKKDLIRTIGFFDERYIGGCYEDDDFIIRLAEKNLPFYETEEVPYRSGVSTWNHSQTLSFFNRKWTITNSIKRNLPEELSTSSLGPIVNENWYNKSWTISNSFIKCNGSVGRSNRIRPFL